ncbi:hypothetical protein FRC04_011314 [Tulasnella sp. 424]|nr:hypothetical protein FRC04_011314 [Tulasnella sp. 424]
MTTIHYLTTTKGLRLKKFKFKGPVRSQTDPDLVQAVAAFITTQKDTLQTIQLLAACLHISPLVGQSLGNLTALDILVGRERRETAGAIQTVVEGCPRVSHLRIGVTAGDFDLNYPRLRAILGWQLLSFEAWSSLRVSVSKDDIADMARAWPTLKKLGIKCRPLMAGPGLPFDRQSPGRWRTPLSRLADIISEFSELEDLDAHFFYDLGQRLGSSLQKLRLGFSALPTSKAELDAMGMFMAAVCPPGLHIHHSYPKDMQRFVRAGRDVGHRWDDLFQKIEELHGGVKVRVGCILEEDDGMWFRVLPHEAELDSNHPETL